MLVVLSQCGAHVTLGEWILLQRVDQTRWHQQVWSLFGVMQLRQLHDHRKGHTCLTPPRTLRIAHTTPGQAPALDNAMALAVTPGNTGDADPAPELITDLRAGHDRNPAAAGAAVYGDCAYGTGQMLDQLHSTGIDAKTKVQAPNAPAGKFTKDHFNIDLQQQQVICPNGVTTSIRPVHGNARHPGKADFGRACTTCPLRPQCTDAKTGRSITIGHHEARLAAARTRQTDPAWRADYRATRPKVERKIAHLMRRRHGGRRARMRGQARVAADFNLLAAAVNLARLATLGLTHTPRRGWALNPA